MKQITKLEQIKKSTHEDQYEKYVEEDMLKVMVNIAESLAIIADCLKERKTP